MTLLKEPASLSRLCSLLFWLSSATFFHREGQGFTGHGNVQLIGLDSRKLRTDIVTALVLPSH